MNPINHAAQNITDGLAWQTANRDQAGIAQNLADGHDIPEVYGLGEAGLFDEFFGFLEEFGITTLFGTLDPKSKKKTAINSSSSTTTGTLFSTPMKSSFFAVAMSACLPAYRKSSPEKISFANTAPFWNDGNSRIYTPRPTVIPKHTTGAAASDNTPTSFKDNGVGGSKRQKYRLTDKGRRRLMQDDKKKAFPDITRRKPLCGPGKNRRGKLSDCVFYL